MRFNISIIALIFILCGCKKKERPGDGDGGVTPPEPFDSTVVWMHRTDSAGGPYDAREPLVWGNHLLWSEAPFGGGFTLHLSDGLTGQKLWQWQGFIAYESLPFFNYQFISGGTYCFNNIAETHSIDLVTGQSNWGQLDRNSGAYIAGIGNHLYGKTQDRTVRPLVCILQRTSVFSKNWDPVLTLTAAEDNGFSPAIFGPSLWMSPVGDSILIFQNRSYNFNTNVSKVDLHAYNLSRDSSLYILRNITPSGNSNVLKPIVDGDFAYLLGSHVLICIDLKAGQIAWQKDLGTTTLFSNMLVDGSRLLVKADNSWLFCLDKISGNTLWTKENLGDMATPMVKADGVVYYMSEGNGTIYGVRIADGKVVMEFLSPNTGKTGTPDAKFLGGVAVNPDLGLLYAHDRYYMMAIKINQKP